MRTVLLLLFLVLGQLSTAQDTLKLLSWNIQLLPGAFLLGHEERAMAIADELSEKELDVIVFQEVFTDKARQILWSKLKDQYPYESGVPYNVPNNFKTSSGIWIISKHPVTLLDFKPFTKLIAYDWWADKGILMVELNVNGYSVRVAGTHMQSGALKICQRIRDNNYLDMQAIVDEFRDKKIPMIIAGDMNTEFYDTVSYWKMIKNIGALDIYPTLSFTSTYQSPDYLTKGQSEDADRMLDYVFIANKTGKVKLIEKNPIIYKRGWGEFGFEDLSDHYAIYCEFILN